jgi:hypothetical protein
MSFFARITPSTLCAALTVSMVLAASPALAKRVAPQAVPAVVYEDVRYEVPHFSNPCGQNGGCLVAYDDATGALLWSLKIYCTAYDSHLESDVQDVFVTTLDVSDGRLVIVNEKNSTFTVDPSTRNVTGAARGCGEEGCSYAPTLPRSSAPSLVWALLFAFVVLARSRSRFSC